MKAILSRRSIRKFKPQKVSEKIIKVLIEAGMTAPSAGNEQPWHFIVIDQRRILDEVPKFHPYAQMMKEAPVAIMICADEKLEKYKGYWVQDCSAATENILIAVQEMGLGAVWLGVYPNQERMMALRRLLSVPDDIIPFSLIPIGYPAEEKAPANRYNPSRVHYNGW